MSDHTPDPWKDVKRYDVDHDAEALTRPNGRFYLVEDVNTARAADAAYIAELEAALRLFLEWVDQEPSGLILIDKPLSAARAILKERP